MGSSPSKRQKLRGLKVKAVSKTKRALHIDSSDGEDDSEQSAFEAAMEEINDSPAFNSSKFLNKSQVKTTGKLNKVVAALQGTAETIRSPIATTKARATRKTAGKIVQNRPYLSRKADLDFLEAFDDLERVQSSRSGSDDEDATAEKNDSIARQEDKLREMEKKRQSMRVAWVTSRHVQRVRVVDLKSPPFPEEHSFERVDDCGYPEYQWGKWFGHVRPLA